MAECIVSVTLPDGSSSSLLLMRAMSSEYLSLMPQADPDCRLVRKTRYCLTENSRYYEIDIYPEWSRQAVLELELRSEADEVVFPKGIEVIREVTGDDRYKNYSLAHHMLDEM